MRVAIFDFDGTLYKKETFKILMSHLKHHPVYHTHYNSFFRWVAPRFIAYKMKVYPEARMKSRSMQRYIYSLDQLSEKELVDYFQGISEKMKSDFNPDVVARLEQHIADGIHVMLVSGAYTRFVKIATDHLTFDTIIGTDIPFKGQHIDKSQSIDHINGTRKNDKILEALAGKDIDWGNSFAYADSYSDLPVLELVGNPVAVDPESKLKSLSEERGWEII